MSICGSNIDLHLPQSVLKQFAHRLEPILHFAGKTVCALIDAVSRKLADEMNSKMMSSDSFRPFVASGHPFSPPQFTRCASSPRSKQSVRSTSRSPLLPRSDSSSNSEESFEEAVLFPQERFLLQVFKQNPGQFVRTGVHNVICTRLPAFWRKNKALPVQFKVRMSLVAPINRCWPVSCVLVCVFGMATPNRCSKQASPKRVDKEFTTADLARSTRTDSRSQTPSKKGSPAEQRQL